MLKIIALVLVGVGMLHAQIPHYCISPPQLTFRAFRHDHDFNIFRRYDVEYDAKSERVAAYEIEEDRAKPGKQYYRFIFLHRFDVAFEINLKTKECKKFSAGKFFDLGVPENATFEDEYYLGGPGESIEVTEWSDRTDFRSESWIGVFSRKKCYPIRNYLRNNNQNRTMTTHIYNLVEGISNPEWFEPPSSCQESGLKMKQPSHHVAALRSIYTHSFY